MDHGEVSHLVFLFKLLAFILPLWGIKYFYVSYFRGIGLRKSVGTEHPFCFLRRVAHRTVTASTIC